MSIDVIHVIKMDQTFPLAFIILQAIKAGQWEGVGTKVEH